MAGFTITRFRCGSCDGDGMLFSRPGTTCTWCAGAGKLPRAQALRQAETFYALASGGYIAGDHSLDECRQEERRANAVYAAFGVVPPWKQTSGRAA
ncbi:hypothetical protein [Methylobacterium indicum]|uniref:hypothetical protein n=1 Tax=Methylobacterium indicum TaxID=1775910 RepID=UPI000A8A3151|nr:hypothetical protein [Methylobacterium indicum]